MSDALNRRVPRFAAQRFAAFQLLVADVARGRAAGEHVHTSSINGRNFYALKRGVYTLYYSVDPRLPDSLVFEEFLTDDEGELIMDVFSEQD